MKILSVMTLLALMTGAAWAGTCPPGKVPASCTDGAINCCMPAGRVDCGNGTNNVSQHYCELARSGGSGGSGGGDGRFLPPQQGGGGRGPAPQGCDPATWQSQGACSMR